MEAKITCLTASIHLPDLNMVLVKGQEVYVPEKTARASQDLHRAWSNKGVHVQYISRFREKRTLSLVGNSPTPPPPPSEYIPEFQPSLSDIIVKGLMRVFWPLLQAELRAMEERILRAVEAGNRGKVTSNRTRKKRSEEDSSDVEV